MARNSMSEFVILDLAQPAPGVAGPARVAMTGALTVRNAEHIHQRLLQAVRDHHDVVLDCANASEIDLSFIQLVLAARKSAAAAGKTLSVAAPTTDLLADTLRRAGVLDTADAPAADQLFWCNKGPSDAEDHSHRR
jgi:anti-anti-sigma regulatory factor